MAETVLPERDILVLDSVTRLPPEAAGRVLIGASHGGRYPAWVAAAAGLRAVILNDAGIGRDAAGIAGLAYLDGIAMAAAAIGHDTARIGDGADMAARGIIRHVNRAAAALGLRPGTSCADAARLLRRAPLPEGVPPPLDEARRRLRAAPGEPVVWGLDSNSLVRPDDRGQIAVTGSHGGLLGGRPETAIKVDCRAAIYNDAGIGCDGAGISRLPALDRRGIAGATVAAASARIGEARSTWEDGVVGHLNETAAAAGGRVGMMVPELVDRLIAFLPRRGPTEV